MSDAMIPAALREQLTRALTDHAHRTVKLENALVAANAEIERLREELAKVGVR